LPIFVDPSKLLSRLNSDSFIKGMFFSGNFNHYRRKVFNLLKFDYYSFNELSFISHNELEHFSIIDYNNKISKINKLSSIDPLIKVKLEIIDRKNKFDILFYYTSIYGLDVNDVPLFELYIPQSKNWSLSSPNRTLLSLQSGFVPVNYGKFDDHEINELSLFFNDAFDFQFIINNNPTKIIFDLTNKIYYYNINQEKYLTPLSLAFKAL
jgi:hypothetical protein